MYLLLSSSGLHRHDSTLLHCVTFDVDVSHTRARRTRDFQQNCQRRRIGVGLDSGDQRIGIRSAASDHRIKLLCRCGIGPGDAVAATAGAAANSLRVQHHCKRRWRRFYAVFGNPGTKLIKLARPRAPETFLGNIFSIILRLSARRGGINSTSTNFEGLECCCCT